jgi:hypothetical protein
MPWSRQYARNDRTAARFALNVDAAALPHRCRTASTKPAAPSDVSKSEIAASSERTAVAANE